MDISFNSKLKVLPVILSALVLLCSLFIMSACNDSHDKADNKAVPQVESPVSSKDTTALNFEDAVAAFNDAGFTNVTTSEIKDLDEDEVSRIGLVNSISIDGKTEFEKGQTFNETAPIMITYHALKKPEDTEPTPTTLNITNSPELNNALETADPYDDSVINFFKSNIGKTIEFDGNIADCQNHGSMKTRFDYLVHAGDYSASNVRGPEMQFNDVSYSDLNTDLDTVPAGINAHIVAEIENINETTGLVELDPVSVTRR